LGYPKVYISFCFLFGYTRNCFLIHNRLDFFSNPFVCVLHKLHETSKEEEVRDARGRRKWLMCTQVREKALRASIFTGIVAHYTFTIYDVHCREKRKRANFYRVW
jgi:hypothetical protein